MPGTGHGSDGAQPPNNREKAFWRIFNKKTIVLVRRWLRLLGVPRRDRRDVAQNVMLAAHESFGNYDPARGPPDRWLNRIAVHTASHYAERARRRVEEPLPDDFDAELEEPSAEEQIISECDRLFALSVLREIDGELGAVLMAHDIEGVPMADFASQSGIPLSTAYKRRTRALSAFQLLAAQRLASMDGAEVRNGARPAAVSSGPPALVLLSSLSARP
ncbi:RNA polymerase sigma factor [Sorangium sp. So ce176]|uniref:RNA polymerase sigma factor n=1 Tax=Sorangium sp. So ce176 TaxID=3133286 RepID=UPI003F642EB7